MVDTVDIYGKLSEEHKPEQALMVRKKVSISEKGVHYVADVNPKRETAVFQIDGDIIRIGCKCDKLLLSKSVAKEGKWNGHFIELKGKNVKHAIEQLDATLSSNIFHDESMAAKFARIVAVSFPSSVGNPIVEKARKKFRETYNCELKTLKSNQPDKV